MQWSLWDALPFKQQSVALPDNKEVALNHLSRLKRRLKTNSKYQNDYLTFLSNLIECDYAEKVPTEEVEMKNGISLTMVYTIQKKRQDKSSLWDIR